MHHHRTVARKRDEKLRNVANFTVARKQTIDDRQDSAVQQWVHRLAARVNNERNNAVADALDASRSRGIDF